MTKRTSLPVSKLILLMVRCDFAVGTDAASGETVVGLASEPLGKDEEGLDEGGVEAPTLPVLGPVGHLVNLPEEAKGAAELFQVCIYRLLRTLYIKCIKTCCGLFHSACFCRHYSASVLVQ